MTLIIKVWDVLHGLAIHIRTPNGKDVVIDAATNKNGFSPLKHIKQNHKVGTIEYAIITHPHMDHIRDIEELIAFAPKVMKKPSHIKRQDLDLSAFSSGDRGVIEKYFELNDSYSSNIDDGHEHNPKNPENYGGVSIQTFGIEDLPKANLNDHSIVTVIEYAGSKILIPGDNEAASWKKLLDKEDFRKAINGTDVFVAAHHGRESGYYKELFQYIAPSIIIISDSPGTDTSAVSRYYTHSKGWKVFGGSAGDEGETRYVLSTRCDGMIQIKCGLGNPKNFREVKICK